MTNIPSVAPSLLRDPALLQRVIDAFPDPIFVKDVAHRIVAINQGYCKLMGRPFEWVLGKSDYDFWPAEQVEVFWHYDDVVISTGEPNENEELVTGADGVERVIWTRKYPMRDEEGSVIGLCGIVTDITTMKQRLLGAQRLEIENREQLATIEAQRALLAKLAAPLIRVWEGVLLLPLIGALTQERAAGVMEGVLDAIGRASARFLIIDVTGTPSLDAMAADALVRAARAASLLGCESVLVGVGPATAQTLINLGVDLGHVVTRATLEKGIEYALGKLSYRIVKASAPPPQIAPGASSRTGPSPSGRSLPPSPEAPPRGYTSRARRPGNLATQKER